MTCLRQVALLLAVGMLPLLHSAELPPGLVIGLSHYSLRDMFTAKQLDPLDYPAFAKREFGITNIDIWEGGLPTEKLTDPDYLKKLKQRADDVGSRIFLLMTGTLDATTTTAKDRQAKAAEHFTAVDRAVTLGCQYLRVFVKAPGTNRAAAIEPCVETLRILADRAKERGIIIVIEPGTSSLSSHGDFLAEVMIKLQHSHCRLMPDFGKLRGDVYAGTKAMMPHTAVISAKTLNFDERGDQIKFDYPRLMRIIVESGYQGIIAIEWEGKGLSPVEGVNASKKLIERALAK